MRGYQSWVCGAGVNIGPIADFHGDGSHDPAMSGTAGLANIWHFDIKARWSASVNEFPLPVSLNYCDRPCQHYLSDTRSNILCCVFWWNVNEHISFYYVAEIFRHGRNRALDSITNGLVVDMNNLKIAAHE